LKSSDHVIVVSLLAGIIFLLILERGKESSVGRKEETAPRTRPTADPMRSTRDSVQRLDKEVQRLDREVLSSE